MSQDSKKTAATTLAIAMFLSAPPLAAFAFTTTIGHPFNTYCLYLVFVLVVLGIIFLLIALSIET